MKESIKIQIPIWNDTLQLICGTRDELFECLKQDGIDDISINKLKVSKNCIGQFTYLADSNYYFIWLSDIPISIKDYGVLVHEISHFVFCFLENRGMNHTDDSDEAYAYLQEYIFCEIDQWIYNYNNPKENECNT